MISDWQTYRLEDFIPFTLEVYFRLIERVNEAWWPLHVMTVAPGLIALLLAWRGKARIALALLAPAWACSGIVFHLQRYAELNWAATYFGWAFLVQAALLIVIALFSRDPEQSPERTLNDVIGAAIALFAIVAYPVVAVIAGHGWSQSETFALHPDPTAMATLGVVLLALHGVRAGIAAVIPVLWLLVTTLTLIALDIPWAWLPAGMVILALGSRLRQRHQLIR